MTTSPLISLRALGKTYATGVEEVHALRPTSLDFPPGHFTAIMGPSGSGKSTLLHILGLMDRPTMGQYFLEDRDISGLEDDRLSELRCRRIGFVFQSFNLFPDCTILENLCVPMRYAGAEEKSMRGRALALLEAVGLTDRAKHRPTHLSGGQCQRAAIARALANDPAVILADEPTGNLDQKTGQEILGLFRRLCASGRTILMVTHNEAYRTLVDRVIELRDGVVAEDTEPTPLRM